MAIFIDKDGLEWVVEFDGFTLDDINSRYGIDLGEPLDGNFAKAVSPGHLWKVLTVACADQRKERHVTERQFAKLVRGDAIQSGRTAVMQALADFFPPSEWSAIQSSLESQSQMMHDLKAAGPLIQEFGKLPLEMRAALMDEMKTAMATGGEDSASQVLAERLSAIALDSMPSNVASDYQANAESPQED